MPAVERKLMKVIAILDRSAGNDSVGEMWKETKSFDGAVRVDFILQWAAERCNVQNISDFRGNLTLTIDQA